MRIEKIKEMSIAELQKEFSVKKQKLNSYQLDLKSGKEKDTSKVKGMKKNIARILTLINFKTVASEVTAAVVAQTEVTAKPKTVEKEVEKTVTK